MLQQSQVDIMLTLFLLLLLLFPQVKRKTRKRRKGQMKSPHVFICFQMETNMVSKIQNFFFNIILSVNMATFNFISLLINSYHQGLNF